MVLNMLSTATMIRLGYVSGNRMSNMQTRNAKLRDRALRIIMAEAGIDERGAIESLEKANGKLPVALLMAKEGCTVKDAEGALAATGGVVERAAELLHRDA
jgi:N-acetylmuramic acid 6-phosphate etherase